MAKPKPITRLHYLKCVMLNLEAYEVKVRAEASNTPAQLNYIDRRKAEITKGIEQETK